MNSNIKSHPKAISKIQAIITVLFVLLLAVGSYFFYFSPKTEEEKSKPPSFATGEALQGIIYYQPDAEIVSGFTTPAGLEAITIKTGLHLYYLTEPKTIDEIYKELIEPVAGNEIAIQYVNPEKQKFSVYPALPASDDIDPIDDPGTFTIPAYHGFALVSKKETRAWRIKTSQHAVEDAVFSENLDAILGEVENGWIFIPGSEDAATYFNTLEIKERIEQIYIQGKGNSFSKVYYRPVLGAGQPSIFTGGYYMMWIELKAEAVATYPIDPGILPAEQDMQMERPATVEITLSDDTPAATTVSSSLVSEVYTKLDFRADKHVTIDSISITRSGLGFASDFESVALYEDASQLGREEIIDSDDRATFDGLQLDIGANITKTITIKAIMNLPMGTFGIDRINKLGIEDDSDVRPAGGQNIIVTGKFPVNGWPMTVP